MIFSGVETLPVQGDAGSGRMVWLSQRILPAESVIDLGGVGQMLKPWHPGPVTALDDLSGFGPGHRLYADIFHRGDVCNLSRFPDRSFDVAVLTEVLEHVPAPWVAMAEAGRVAGRVLITVPFEMRWQQPIAFKIAGHVRFYTVDMLALHLRRAGLDGSVGILDFSGFSFLVAEVARVAG